MLLVCFDDDCIALISSIYPLFLYIFQPIQGIVYFHAFGSLFYGWVSPCASFCLVDGLCLYMCPILCFVLLSLVFSFIGSTLFFSLFVFWWWLVLLFGVLVICLHLICVLLIYFVGVDVVDYFIPEPGCTGLSTAPVSMLLGGVLLYIFRCGNIIPSFFQRIWNKKLAAHTIGQFGLVPDVTTLLCTTKDDRSLY